MTTLYMKVADDLMAKRRTLREPARLPVEQELAEAHRVGRDTIRRALKVLEERGAVTRRRGSGTYLQPVVPAVGSLDGKTVGFVPPWWADSITAWFTSRVFEGVSHWADGRRCQLSVLHAERKPTDPAAWMARLRERNVAALLWLHPRPEQLALIERTAQVMPCVVVGREDTSDTLHYVVPDFGRICRLIDEHLVAHGHDRYAVIGTSILDAFAQTWLRGLHRVHADRGARFEYSHQFLDIRAYDRRQLAKLLLELYLPIHEDIRALVLTSSSFLTPLLADDRFRGRLEEDLSIVTWDYGLYPMEAYWPGHTISHATCDWSRIGQRAMDALSMIATGGDVPRVVTEQPGFCAGQTVRPHPGTTPDHAAPAAKP